MANQLLSSIVRTIKSKGILSVRCSTTNVVDTTHLEQGKGKISIIGENNQVRFAKGVKFNGTIEIRGKNNLVEFGEASVIKGHFIVRSSDQSVTIGDHTTLGSVRLLCDEGCNVTIGRWCMFSRNVEIRTTDAHSVVDRKTGLRLNKAGSITIGDHVWVGLGVVLNKGVVVSTDSIIGANSFVNKKFTEPGVVIAGVPARVVRTGVTWHPARKNKFMSLELDYWKQKSPESVPKGKEPKA